MIQHRHYLGLDIGTSACKAVVFDELGCQIASAAREYDLHLTPDGGAELDPDDVSEQCLSVISEAAHQAQPGSVRALGISSQGEAFTAIGRDGRALCGAMVSSDARAVRYAQEWPDRFGIEKLYNITGHTAHPMFTLFKLLWLRDHRPEVWTQTYKFLCFEDLLHLRLGLCPTIGWPLAGRTMLFDVRRHLWSEEILRAVGLSPGQLARPVASGTVVGTVPKMIGEQLGLAPGAVVVAGGHDQPCGALGAGATVPGIAMYATGTVECITPAFAEPVFGEALRQSNLCTYDHTVRGMYVTVAFSLTGGNILKWFRDEFAPGQSYSDLLNTVTPEPTALQVLPYWTPSGTPHFDVSTPGAITGLRLRTKRGELLRALLEGVALEMRLNLEILGRSGCRIDELRAIGGGAKSAWWTQLKADILGCPITTPDVTDAGCLGMAMLACAGETQISLRELSSRWVRITTSFHPRAHYARIYTEKFATYKELYHTLKQLYKSAG